MDGTSWGWMEVMALLPPLLPLLNNLEVAAALALSASESESSDRAMEEEAEIRFIVAKARQGNPQSSPATGYISVTVK